MKVTNLAKESKSKSKKLYIGKYSVGKILVGLLLVGVFAFFSKQVIHKFLQLSCILNWKCLMLTVITLYTSCQFITPLVQYNLNIILHLYFLSNPICTNGLERIFNKNSFYGFLSSKFTTPFNQAIYYLLL